MAILGEHDLGRLIFLANPYTLTTYNLTAPAADGVAPGAGGMEPDDTQTEKQQDVQWSFKGVPHDIEVALRIAYTYTDQHGVKVRDYLLIGYAGGGAY
jgi:hypothetical protein